MSYVYDTEYWCKIWRKTDYLFQKWQEFGEFSSEHSKVSKICTFIGPFCAKYYILIYLSPKKVQRSYLSWHWRVMQNLKKNWLVVSKMIWIWQIFTRAFKNLKICTLMSYFRPKYKMFKGCVRYIFASLFFMSKRSTYESRQNVFYFTSKALFVFEIIKF